MLRFYNKDGAVYPDFSDCLQLNDGKKHIVSIVGGGGKTSILYALAKWGAECGKRVLVSTTTKILAPESSVFADSPQAAEMLWQRGSYAVIGTKNPGGKLEFAPALYQLLKDRADLILFEADGAKHLPCKAPRAHEPVILPEADTVLSVVGLDTLGRVLEEICFCPEQVRAVLRMKETGHVMQEADIVDLLLSEDGGKKSVEDRRYFPIVNKCDIAMEGGREILRLLEEKGVQGFLCCTLDRG